MTTIEITEFTDPACPFAWSAEPARRRIEWLYGDGIRLAPRMVGLHESGEEMEAKGLTTAKLAAGTAELARSHHMPIDTGERERLAGSIDACRAVVAVRRGAPERERAMLRALRVVNFAGELLDETGTLHRAAERAGVDPSELDAWRGDPVTATELHADLAAARSPTREALALAGKLAGTPDGGHRYTCPSWELSRDGRTVTVPGFQPLAAYEIAIANLAPELPRRRDPGSVAEVLQWAQEPLATAEVAAVCAIDLDDARQALGRIADEEHIGFDGLWALR